MNDRLVTTSNWRGQGHMAIFLFRRYHIFAIGKAKPFKFCVLTDAQQY